MSESESLVQESVMASQSESQVQAQYLLANRFVVQASVADQPIKLLGSRVGFQPSIRLVSTRIRFGNSTDSLAQASVSQVNRESLTKSRSQPVNPESLVQASVSISFSPNR